MTLRGPPESLGLEKEIRTRKQVRDYAIRCAICTAVASSESGSPNSYRYSLITFSWNGRRSCRHRPRCDLRTTIRFGRCRDGRARRIADRPLIAFHRPGGRERDQIDAFGLAEVARVFPGGGVVPVLVQRASISSISMALAAWLKIASATRIDLTVQWWRADSPTLRSVLARPDQQSPNGQYRGGV